MERAAPHVTGWSARILGLGDRDMPDAVHGIPSWTASDTGAYGFHRHAHGVGYTGTRITPRCRGAPTGGAPLR